MTDDVRTGLWSFIRPPLRWQRRWIQREIEAAYAKIEEVDAKHEARNQELRHAISTQALIAVQEIDARHRALMRHIEVRSIAGLREALQASVAERIKLQKVIESRATIAGAEARAYADESVGALSKSLAASNRVVVNTVKRVNALELELLAKANALAEAQSSTAEQLAETEEKVLSRINLVPDILNARIKPLDEAIDNIAKSLLKINEIPSVPREIIDRLEKTEMELGRIVADYNMQMRNAEQRIEFIRSETLYEMQASALRASAETFSERTIPRILNQGKVDAMREGGLRINVGCGQHQIEGFLNVDRRSLPGIDVVADATNIPFERGELLEIRSSHLVEHFSSYILDRVLLPHWASLLQAGGTLTTVAPDGAAMLKAVNDGTMEFEDFREVLFGSQDYDGDFHYNLITPNSFSESLRRAGFVEIHEEYSAKRNGKCFEFKITAKKA